MTYIDASSVGRCCMPKHVGKYRLMYEFYFSFVHMLVCTFGCRHPVHGVFDSVSADTQPIPTEFSRGFPQTQLGKHYPENGGSKLPCCQTLVVVYESTRCYMTETGNVYAQNLLT
jgi:hypothetical protein